MDYLIGSLCGGVGGGLICLMLEILDTYDRRKKRWP